MSDYTNDASKIMRELPLLAVVVNDDAGQRRMLADLLAKGGLKVAEYADPEAALKAMDVAVPPGLIVTDIHLPGIDGWQFCRLLRSPEYSPFNQVPILVVSSTFTGQEPEHLSASLGANGFMSLPISAEEFERQVKLLLRGEKPSRGQRVLVIEDNELLATMIRKEFEAKGYQADAAFTGDQAEQLFLSKTYDIVIIDHHLPDMEGDQLMPFFRELQPSAVYLTITGDPTPELALRWSRLGAFAHVTKPFSIPFLIEQCARGRREKDLLLVEERLEKRTLELQQREATYRGLVENVPDVVWTVNEHSRTVFISPRVTEVLGFAPQAAMVEHEKFWFSRVHMDDQERVRAAYHQLFAGEGRMDIEYRMQRKDERWIWVHDRAFRVYTKYGERHADGLLSDITERKRAEEERERLSSQLAQAQKMESVGRLAGGVAHDFNNMLQAIMGNAALALDDVPPGTRLRESIEQIQECGQRSADLTRQLLAFARKQPIMPRTLDLNDTVESLLKMLRRLIGEDITLAWQPAAGLWPVRIDPSQVDQVLANLCVNARDAIRGNGRIIIETSNAVVDELSASEHPGVPLGHYVLLGVTDDGCGIPREIQERVFEPFFTTKEMGRGTGLGLATVYGIVQQNHGTIQMQSEPGQGTTFKIYLPRVLESALQFSSPKGAPVRGNGDETVLLIEDEPSILQVCQRTLEALGYKTIPASNPGQALQLAQERGVKFDLVLTDVIMPEMNGRELYGRLQALQPKLKCLFMSGYPSDVIVQHGIKEEGWHFLPKPFTIESLATKVRAALEQ